MGKGGTKFEGDAIGVRGKIKTGLSSKEMRRNMVRRAPWAGGGGGLGDTTLGSAAGLRRHMPSTAAGVKQHGSDEGRPAGGAGQGRDVAGARSSPRARRRQATAPHLPAAAALPLQHQGARAQLPTLDFPPHRRSF
jgi:hypothetical protein